MKTIKINFEGFWGDFDYRTFLPYKILTKYFNVVVSENPDYLFCSVYNNYEYCRFSGVRIFYTGECFSPDFNIVDYAISFDDIQFKDRAIQMPYFAFSMINQKLDMEKGGIVSKEDLKKKDRFCNFIYSHEGIPERKLLFDKLSGYKKVDSAGIFLNNMPEYSLGSTFSDKIKFQRNYKFSIACENYVYPGYITEKIAHAFVSGTIPIYFGDPSVTKYFNPNAFINCSGFSSLEEMVEFVKKIDNDDELYLAMINQPIFNAPDFINHAQSHLESFLKNIFDQEYSTCFRRPKTVWPAGHEKKLIRLTRLEKIRHKMIYNKFIYAMIKILRHIKA